MKNIFRPAIFNTPRPQFASRNSSTGRQNETYASSWFDYENCRVPCPIEQSACLRVLRGFLGVFVTIIKPPVPDGMPEVLKQPICGCVIHWRNFAITNTAIISDAMFSYQNSISTCLQPPLRNACAWCHRACGQHMLSNNGVQPITALHHTHAPT